jgi:hypothetical protein
MPGKLGRIFRKSRNFAGGLTGHKEIHVMKKSALMMKLVQKLIVVVAFLVLNVSALQAQVATLAIQPNGGDANPLVQLVSDATTNRKITATFSVSLSVPDDKVEDGKKKVKSQTYTLTSTGALFAGSDDIVVSDTAFNVDLWDDYKTVVLTKNAIPDAMGNYDWTINGDGNFTVTASVYCDQQSAEDNDKKMELSGSATYIGPGGDATVSSAPDGMVKFTALKVTLESPTGNPLESATARVNVNEFTYNNASVGICAILCRAKLEPDTEATTKWAEDNLVWASTAGGRTSTTWVSNRAGGPLQSNNQGKNVTLQLKGLPLDNSGFGSKTITMSGGQDGNVTGNIQVFFNRDATNHPGDAQTPPNRASDRSPNWFYYWGKAMGFGPKVYFNSNTPIGARQGCTPAMWFWANPLPTGITKTDIWLSNAAVLPLIRRDGTDAPSTGIDAVANVLAHERRHVKQIEDADALLTSRTGRWATGWSWQGGGVNPVTYASNHWNIVTTGNVTSVVNLGPPGSDWPFSFQYPDYGSSSEEDAQLWERVEEGDNEEFDFADHGKQHQTNGDWDD